MKGGEETKVKQKILSINAICLAFLLIVLTVALTIDTVNAEADLAFLEYSSYVDSYGWLHVIGEVQNNGTEPLRFVEIVASFYNASDEFVGSDWTYTFIDIIDVGKTSPFEIVFMEETQVPKVDYYTLSVEFSTTAELNPEADLTILYHSNYVDIIDTLHIIGEVQNNGTVPLYWCQVIATFYNSSDDMVAIDYAYTDVDVINVNETSPFEILFFEETQIPKIDYYTLELDFDVTSPLTPALEMLSNSSYVDTNGWLHIIGEIENNGTETATYVEIVASLYDSEGNIVLKDFTYTTPSEIDSGEKAPFEITIIDDERVPLVETYSLSVQSNEYDLIPELSALLFSLLIVPLLAIAGLAPLLTRRKTIPKV